MAQCCSPCKAPPTALVHQTVIYERFDGPGCATCSTELHGKRQQPAVGSIRGARLGSRARGRLVLSRDRDPPDARVRAVDAVASQRTALCDLPFALRWGRGADHAPGGVRAVPEESAAVRVVLRQGTRRRDAARCGLFADVRGFTSMAERQDPADVAALLNRFYDAAVDVLCRHAIIDK